MISKYFLILAVFIISCKSEDNGLFRFDPRVLDENALTLSDIADDIVYIPLKSSIPLGMIYTFKIVDNYIYLSAKDIGILVFKRDGKLLGRIGAIGRGPDEYIFCNDFIVDESGENVYVKDSGNRIKVYSRHGDFLRDIYAQEYSGDIEHIEFQYSRLFIFNYLQFGDSKYNWIVLDTSGNLIQDKERTTPVFHSNYGGGNSGVYKFENKIHYWNIYNDTVYSILPDLSDKASFIISPGDYKLPRSDFNPATDFFTYMQLYNIIESSRYLIIRFFYKRLGYFILDKTSSRSYTFYFKYDGNESLSRIGGFSDNIDGGPVFKPESYFTDHDLEYLTTLIEPYNLKSYVGTEEFKNSTPKYPEKKKELEKLANSLKETDNPVLMLVRLKK